MIQQSFFKLVREARDEGRTVFLSSHIIGEVERTCDRVAIIRDGNLVKVDTVAGLRDLAAHQLELRFAVPVPAAAFAGLEGVADAMAEDNTVRMRVAGPIGPVLRLAALYDLVDVSSSEQNLEDVFLAEYAGDKL